MAQPPTKRQKRLVVLSSDDDESTPDSASIVSVEKEDRSTVSRTSAKVHKNASRIQPRTRSHKERSVSADLPKSSKLTYDAKLPLLPAKTGGKVAGKSKPTARVKSSGRNHTSQSISTFFNPANLAQLSNSQRRFQKEERDLNHQEEESVEKVNPEYEDLIEDISSTEDEEEARETQNGTRSVLDRRKKDSRAIRTGLGLKREEGLLNGIQKFKIGGSATNNAPITQVVSSVLSRTDQTDTRPWAERFEPRDLGELAVHKKKVSDVQNWLDSVLEGRIQKKRLLILTGPSGSGRTATISLLSKAMRFELLEWKNPVSSEFSSEGYVSMSARFQEFLGRNARFNALEMAGSIDEMTTIATAAAQNEKNRRKVVLLEEFPNTFVGTARALDSFRSCVTEYLAICNPPKGTLLNKKLDVDESPTPIVMIITETRAITADTIANDSFTAHKLLGSGILGHPAVTVMEFNPIAPTYLSKALEIVIKKEARQSGTRRIPSSSVLKKLGEVGDVRSAIGSLEFLCLRGGDGDDWGGRVASKAKKGDTLSKMERDSSEVVPQRESSLGLFHAIGKVVYNKRDDLADIDTNPKLLPQPPGHRAEQARTRISQVSVDRLIDQTGTDTITFIAGLHENYVLSCEGTSFVDSLNDCLDVLSGSDVIMSASSGNYGGRPFPRAGTESLRQDEICFQLCVRGLLFALPDPVKRRTHPVAGKSGGKNDTHKLFYPTSMRLSKQMDEIDDLIDRWLHYFRADAKPLSHASTSKLRRSTPGAASVPSIPESTEASEPLRTTLGFTKAELILERLPYITKIEERKIPKSAHLSTLEKVTKFHGLDPPPDVDDVSEEGEENMADAATLYDDKSSRDVIRQASKNPETLILPLEEEAGKLYLSDDDIEDS